MASKIRPSATPLDQNSTVHNNTLKFTFPEVTTEFVKKQLSSIPENKATGLDKLSGRLLRAAAPVVAQPQAFILNLSLQSGKFITEWKHTKVLPFINLVQQ